MNGLNPSQTEAVKTLSGPLLVLAGAGTGKTRVITFRIANLIRNRTRPERILGMTFTNKAANEMKERIGQMLASSASPSASPSASASARGISRNSDKNKKFRKEVDQAEATPELSTFHSLCVKILRRHITLLGYPPKFAIYSRGDQESLARQVLREIRVHDKMLAPGQLLFWISNWKSKSWNPAQAAVHADSDAQHLAAVAYKRYQTALKLRGCVDFDDLLLLTESLFQNHESVRQQEADRFDHILVDEYQDTNQSQYQIVKALAARHRNLCVVGDDDQSIYGWRGAEVEHILSFRQDWPDAKVVRLQDNYRSTEAIIEMSNTLIQFNTVRNDKVLIAARPGGEVPHVNPFPNEQLEAAGVIRSIKQRIEQQHRQPRDFAILFRTNEQPRLFETELRKNELPYILVGGMSFFDRKEVKDVLAYLRLLDETPDDISILRIINTPPRGLGKQSIELLLNHAIKHQLPLWHLFNGAAERPAGLSAVARRGLNQLNETMEQVQRFAANRSSLVEVAKYLLETIKYRQEIERHYDDPDDRETRWNTVEQIINSLAEYEQSKRKPTLTDFLDKLLLGEQDTSDEKEKQLKKNAIALMTIHSAKGLEFPEVYIVGMEEGILPHHRSLEDDEAGVDEERRLCYVAVTRAEERLTLSFAQTRMKWGKPRQSHPSRFLYELTGKTDHPLYKPGRNSPHTTTVSQGSEN